MNQNLINYKNAIKSKDYDLIRESGYEIGLESRHLYHEDLAKSNLDINKLSFFKEYLELSEEYETVLETIANMLHIYASNNNIIDNPSLDYFDSYMDKKKEFFIYRLKRGFINLSYQHMTILRNFYKDIFSH